MRTFTERLMAWSKSEQKEARGCGRIRVELITCNLGEVVDMSATGVRVRRRSFFKPRCGRVVIELDSIDGIIQIPARVVRVVQAGQRQWELGIEFQELNEAARKTVSEIGRVSGTRGRMGTEMADSKQQRSA